METVSSAPDANESCPPCRLADYRELGMDDSYAEVSVSACQRCGQHWLRYFYEHEAFTASGRWYLGAITPEQHAALTPHNAKSIMEGLEWYYYGGSFYYGKSGRTSGKITL